ncbi:hypothetical protein NFI96_008378 [Prochilodus magdalenae]|nr:hypothetical protein NFI96_008378 [Prochilodus magdalenae]
MSSHSFGPAGRGNAADAGRHRRPGQAETACQPPPTTHPSSCQCTVTGQQNQRTQGTDLVPARNTGLLYTLSHRDLVIAGDSERCHRAYRVLLAPRGQNNGPLREE